MRVSTSINCVKATDGFIKMYILICEHSFIVTDFIGFFSYRHLVGKDLKKNTTYLLISSMVTEVTVFLLISEVNRSINENFLTL